MMGLARCYKTAGITFYYNGSHRQCHQKSNHFYKGHYNIFIRESYQVTSD